MSIGELRAETGYGCRADCGLCCGTLTASCSARQSCAIALRTVLP